MRRNYLVLSFVFFLSLVSLASAKTTYTVKNGDSLDRISKKFDVSVSDLKEANKLKSIKLSIGTKLSVPDSNKNENKEAKLLTKKNISRKQANKAGDVNAVRRNTGKDYNNEESLYHFVKKGDTLKSVARRYSVSEVELKKMNNMKTSRLKTGHPLLVKKIEPKTYTVKKGDNIYRIAKKFNKSSTEIKEINDLQEDNLKVGQEIRIARIIDDKDNEETPSNDIKPIQDLYNARANPAGTSEKIKEVKNISLTDDLSQVSIKDRLLLFAKKMLHIPYKFGANGSIGLDCSSYVQKVYEIAGIPLPRSARQQFHAGEPVNKEELLSGDLVFFRTYASFPSHVGIYLGNNLFIHASSRSKKVTIDSLETPYYIKRFIGAKRLIEEEKINILEIPEKEI